MRSAYRRNRAAAAVSWPSASRRSSEPSEADGGRAVLGSMGQPGAKGAGRARGMGDGRATPSLDRDLLVVQDFPIIRRKSFAGVRLVEREAGRTRFDKSRTFRDQLPLVREIMDARFDPMNGGPAGMN